MGFKRKFPPYSRVLHEQLRSPKSWKELWGTSLNNETPSLTVFAGPRAWESAEFWRGRRLFMVAPEGQDPKDFDWSITNGLGLLLIDAGPDPEISPLDRLAAALLRDGADGALALRTGGLRYLPPQSDAA